MTAQTALSVAVVLLAALVAWFGAPLFARIETALGQVAQRKGLAILIAGVVPLAIRLALLPVLPIPIPQAHDEFSYLLAADTFAHGRLANPPHAAAIYFETMHVLMHPTYVSIYPPAQGLALAFGQVFFGHPWVGVWLSFGCMCAAACWMLQGCLPPGWALFGSLLFGLRLGILSYWMNSYWGGAVAACGGMLVLGALPRMLEGRSRWAAFWLGLGIAILANSRPYEGAVLVVLVALPICWRSWKEKTLPVLWPAALVILLSAGCMALYFQRTTGNPLRMPYVVYREAASTAPHFVFQRPRPEPKWNYDVLREFYTSELHDYTVAREHPFQAALAKLVSWWRFYIGITLTLPLIVFCFWKKPWARAHWITLAIFLAVAITPQVWFSPHYAAPATGLVMIAVTAGLARIHIRSPWLVRTIALCACATIVVNASFKSPGAPGSRWTAWGVAPAGFSRASVAAKLDAAAGQHLVLVHYSPHHNFHQEWVYNDADIDNSKIVWARDSGPFLNRTLLRHFQGRRVWLVDPDGTPPRVAPYPGELIGDPERLSRAMLDAAPAELLTCDQWNYVFTRATGLEAAPGCEALGARDARYSIDRWMVWMGGHQ